jgi:DNA-binding winged helix-turn-helix (wHTH) protein
MDAITHGFQLEGLLVAPLTGELSGPGGTVRLDPKVMDVLVLMATQPRQVILREEFVVRLWGHAVVTDDALTRCFYELRRNLVHAGGNERYRNLIETVPKRGYRLNAVVTPGLPAHSVTATSAEPKPRPAVLERPRRAWPAIAVAVALVIAIGGAVTFWTAAERANTQGRRALTNSIAVLPFLDMSENRDQHYLADGMTEEILNHLAQAENLRVSPEPRPLRSAT